MWHISRIHSYFLLITFCSFLGNFLELLEFRSIENELIRNKLKSLKYTHHSIQNEILNLIQENILSQIIFEIKNAKYFSIFIKIMSLKNLLLPLETLACAAYVFHSFYIKEFSFY